MLHLLQTIILARVVLLSVCKGMFIAASIVKLEHVADIVSTEAAAPLEGLKLAHNIRCNSLLAQMDNLVAVEAVQQWIFYGGNPDSCGVS